MLQSGSNTQGRQIGIHKNTSYKTDNRGTRVLVLRVELGTLRLINNLAKYTKSGCYNKPDTNIKS